MSKLKQQNFETKHAPVWCQGCGNFAIWTALKKALAHLGILPHETLIVYGIGCSGNMVNTVGTYAFHALHGRTLPVAIGAKLANSRLTVIAVAGDGDAYGEGLNHLVHAIRGNYDITMIVHDNRVYGLTTGQAAPTATRGFKGKSTPDGLAEEPLNPVALALASGASFVARGFAGTIDHLTNTVIAAVEHPGFALVDVLQPCVTFNSVNTYAFYRNAVEDLRDDPKFKADNRSAAFERALVSDKMPIGIFYQNKNQPRFESGLAFLNGRPLVARPAARRDVAKLFREFI